MEEDGPRCFAHHLTGDMNIVDDALRAFIKMQKMLKESEDIQQMCRDERLQKKLPGYTVRMGYGLHLGWSIEGAVGSKYKVDATYLSLNVDLASFLEGATKTYSVAILMSQNFVECLGLQLRCECRPVDHVAVGPAETPVTLYCHLPTEAPEFNEEQRLEFMRRWLEIFELYRNGSDWGRAKTLIEDCLAMKENDGPSKWLWKFIDDNGDAAPPDWPGYRK
eukprot:NODE_7090_length_1610_cov_4.346595.p2 GENE.NODE_7090_length_1610_cov_4.346595~~NODE_7090_length_1610_cov_4.346595.p2  ORF type:complete len:221 (+),score=58.13 NODE_7090_length_1610_cov_4.346595:757-1419(+)